MVRNSFSAACASVGVGHLEVHRGDIRCAEETIDEVERWRCWYELYEGAIYLNRGRKYEVTSWEVFGGVVRVRCCEGAA